MVMACPSAQTERRDSTGEGLLGGSASPAALFRVSEIRLQGPVGLGLSNRGTSFSVLGPAGSTVIRRS
jgi:hypothetical protein